MAERYTVGHCTYELHRHLCTGKQEQITDVAHPQLYRQQLPLPTPRPSCTMVSPVSLLHILSPITHVSWPCSPSPILMSPVPRPQRLTPSRGLQVPKFGACVVLTSLVIQDGHTSDLACYILKSAGWCLTSLEAQFYSCCGCGRVV